MGALPALMVVFTMKFLREPEPWLRAKAEGRLSKGNIWLPIVICCVIVGGVRISSSAR